MAAWIGAGRGGSERARTIRGAAAAPGTIRGAAALAIALTAVVALVGSARAADPERPGDRAEALRAELAGEARRARLWGTSWTALYGGLTVGQGTLAGLTHDHDERVDMSVGAATSFLGLAAMLLGPLDAVTGAVATLDAMPAGTADERRRRDELAIRLRDDAARAEREGRSWLAHTLNAAVAVGSSLILWKGFGRDESAATNFASGIAVGELQIWTQPTGLLRDPPDAAPPAPPRSAALGWSGRLLYVRLAF